MPLAVQRLMLSLKKAADSPGSQWSLSGTGQIESIRFACRKAGGTERNENITPGHVSSEVVYPGAVVRITITDADPVYVNHLLRFKVDSHVG